MLGTETKGMCHIAVNLQCDKQAMDLLPAAILSVFGNVPPDWFIFFLSRMGTIHVPPGFCPMHGLGLLKSMVLFASPDSCMSAPPDVLICPPARRAERPSGQWGLRG